MTPGDDRLAVAVEELQDLKGVWVEIGKIWENVDELRDKPWLSVQPRKVNLSIDVIMMSLKFDCRYDKLLMVFLLK